ncbi:MAG: nicotinamide-nucleotide amidohydrolase family protein [Oceanospirillales bacterium TMED33]|nr:damage-inducible protein CinA [Gammaproteobacteria bacterium]RPG22235.1 MAG: nicotinamide-nucleotide amidohydrolase family protein [Oceanospirillales bacterium TMED33]CAI8404152.1 MAG: Nicotinamide-nucleotide amidohydrolase PncC [Gammaproteobacteria bacterium]
MTREVSVVLNGLHARLIATNQTVSVAESCTGGLLGAALTELPGSSCYFLGGVQAYANEVKEGLLGVSHETLVSFGAVSEEVASEMANGIQRLTGSDWAISTTGVAGPDGGSSEKPVGTVWISVVGCDGLFSQKLELDGDRTNVRQGAVRGSLSMLLEHLPSGGSTL